jgi:molybdopterin converting factor small subunit
MNKVNILAFGPIVDIVGKKTFEMDGLASTEALKLKLEADFPALKNLQYAIAVDMQFITTETSLEGVETVALLPPYSGG